MNLPNKLTITRIILTFPVVIFLQFGNNTIFAILSLILFVIASITDYLDGYFARKYNLISDLGKFLDQISDKFLITATAVMFFNLGMLNVWLLLVIILRDILVSGIRMYAASKEVVIPANYFGKLKTVSQIVLIVFLYIMLVFNIETVLISILLQLIVGVLTAGSGIKYLLDSLELFKGDEKK